MEFQKYVHIERFGTSEVEGIERGECYVFPKLDGTNASVWINEHGEVQAGSRKRHLSLDSDNAGFCEFAKGCLAILLYLTENPTHRLFGEWLVPHTLKTYREEAWRKFYVFDVVEDLGNGYIYLPYNKYQPLLEKHGILYTPPIAIIENGTHDQFVRQLERNTFLIEDGKGVGEGVVIKNYSFINKYNRLTWAKIVSSEFKEKHTKLMGAPKIKGKKLVEEEIAKKYVTTALCEKTRAKIELENDGFSSKQIPRLLNTVYYELIREESWDFVKEFKYPTIDYNQLRKFVFEQVKERMPQLF
jgi:hypothetical protein